jgi:hypothetical protein
MQIGDSLGNFRLVEELAKGGFGKVYLAEHVESGHRVAVKVLHSQWSSEKEQVQRFFNEARAATRIDDPGIVKVLDLGYSPSGEAYLIAEYLAGESLGRRLKRGPLAPAKAAQVARQIARALGKAHDAKIVHRDLKPDNIILVPDEEVGDGERAKVLDFGIAKLGESGQAATLTSTVFGTPHYMSPEQCRSAAHVDPRSDIYSLGCILFEMLAGRPPFTGEAGDVIGKQQYISPPRLSELAPGTPPELEELVVRLLAKDPAHRPSSMTEVAQALRAFVDGAPPSASITPARVIAPSLPAGDTLPAAVSGAATVARPAPVPMTRKRKVFYAAAAVLGLGIVVNVAQQSGPRTISYEQQPDLIEPQLPVPPVPPSPMIVDLGPQLEGLERLEMKIKGKVTEDWVEKLAPQLEELVAAGQCERLEDIARDLEGQPEAQKRVEQLAGDCDPDEVIQRQARYAEALAALNRGAFPEARGIAEGLLEERARDPIALSIAAMAACDQHMARDAARFAGKLSARRAAAVKARCLQRGVKLDE